MGLQLYLKDTVLIDDYKFFYIALEGQNKCTLFRWSNPNKTCLWVIPFTVLISFELVFLK